MNYPFASNFSDISADLECFKDECLYATSEEDFLESDGSRCLILYFRKPSKPSLPLISPRTNFSNSSLSNSSPKRKDKSCLTHNNQKYCDMNETIRFAQLFESNFQLPIEVGNIENYATFLGFYQSFGNTSYIRNWSCGEGNRWNEEGNIANYEQEQDREEYSKSSASPNAKHTLNFKYVNLNKAVSKEQIYKFHSNYWNRRHGINISVTFLGCFIVFLAFILKESEGRRCCRV